MKYNLVLNLLKKHKEGLTVTEISKLLNISRNTTAISLARLDGAKKIKIRNVGMAKLHFLK